LPTAATRSASGAAATSSWAGSSRPPDRERTLFSTKIDPAGAAAAAPWPFVFNGSGNADDEILSMVVEGTIVYATGYESATSQGKNLFVMKIDTSVIDAGGLQPVLWKRTFHGAGDDRGVSLKTTATHVYLSGDTDVGAGDFDIFVWKLLK
jgi:hypothetical protein